MVVVRKNCNTTFSFKKTEGTGLTPQKVASRDVFPEVLLIFVTTKCVKRFPLWRRNDDSPSPFYCKKCSRWGFQELCVKFCWINAVSLPKRPHMVAHEILFFRGHPSGQSPSILQITVLYPDDKKKLFLVNSEIWITSCSSSRWDGIWFRTLLSKEIQYQYAFAYSAINIELT